VEESSFELLISSFIETNVGVSNHFLSDRLSSQLQKNSLALYQQDFFHEAGIGSAEQLVHRPTIRNDAIYWLDKSHNNVSENEYLVLMEDFIRYLNISCYAGIVDGEFHYSIFEVGGFYKKHLDQFMTTSTRKYSLISYLNEDWQEQDGGQLLIHQPNQNQLISPTNGKTVFFKSDELKHEVLVSNKRRMSVTGWLRG